ncbi:hypothetical protein ILUMI_14652, partial [Ignelater luminosus]
MLKVGGERLEEYIHMIIKNVWQEEKVPKRWKESMTCPIHQEAERTRRAEPGLFVIFIDFNMGINGTKLDLLKSPPTPSSQARTCPKVRQLSVGDRVQARWYPTTCKPTWRLGTIMQKFGKLHYLVKLDSDGYSLKRHVNQLLRVTIDINSQPKTRVRFTSFLPSNIQPYNNDEQRRGPPVELQPEPPEVHPEPRPILRRS